MGFEKISQDNAVDFKCEVARGPEAEQLKRYRSAITEIDLKMIDLLRERQNVVAQIGVLKQTQDWPIRDQGRESTHVQSLVQANQDIQPDVIKSVMSVLFEVSVNLQDSLG